MIKLLRVADQIDRFSDRCGRAISWLTLAMVLVGAFNAIVRYLDRFTGWGLSSNTYIEAQWYLFSLVFLLAAAYTLRQDAHVRVDVLLSRLSPKGKAWVDFLGVLLFLFPFCVMMLIVSWPSVINSWSVFEMSPDPGGLPRFPLKTAIPVAFFLLMVQGVSMLIRSLAIIVGYDSGRRDGRAV